MDKQTKIVVKYFLGFMAALSLFSAFRFIVQVAFAKSPDEIAAEKCASMNGAVNAFVHQASKPEVSVYINGKAYRCN
ncbi:MAG: hypothetical protein HC815_27555 [Richelia sp. RM1_1_1]|nr:hypothetical protein [Richelia sp. RM1_1_1]